MSMEDMRNVDGPRGRGRSLARSRFDGSAVALDRDLLREALVRTLLGTCTTVILCSRTLFRSELTPTTFVPVSYAIR